MLDLALFFICGLVSGGIIFHCIWVVKATFGDLVVVKDPEDHKHYLYLNINKDTISKLRNNQTIILKVKKEKVS